VSASAETAKIVEALERAIIDSRLPSQYSMAGEKLLSQLQTTPRLTFAGQHASGKTSLINMILGEAALPSLSFGQVIDLGFGAVESTVIEYEDDVTVEHDGIVLDPDRPQDVFRISIRRPIDSLRFQTFSEIRLDAMDAKTSALLEFIVQHSTITIWCSEVFDEREQKLWASLPDYVKDHGFLALTMADRQIMKGALEENLRRLESFVSEEFFDVFPVAVLQALKARQDMTTTGRELWDLSGGSHLFNTIQRQLSLGREEDTDRARLLLEHVSEPVSRPQDAKCQGQRASIEKNAAPGARQRKSDNHLSEALTSLSASAEKMLRDADDLGAFDCSTVLATCLETMQSLAADLADASEHSGEVRRLLADVQESENMLLLFKIEQDDEAALDAVSLLLQMKKEIAHRLPT